MSNSEVVWATHPFVAENPDELSFKAGEPIVVLGRDEGFDDGWWHASCSPRRHKAQLTEGQQGRNAAGKTGIFPYSYTSTQNPSAKPLALTKRTSNGTTPDGTAAPDVTDTLDEIDSAMRQHRNQEDSSAYGQDNDSADDLSVVSKDESAVAGQDLGQHYHDPAQARQVLAARAKAQIDRAANQRVQAKELQASKWNGTHFYDSDDEYAPVQGLEFSDESDVDDDVPAPASDNPADLAASIRGNRASFAQYAHMVPLPPTEPGTPRSPTQYRTSHHSRLSQGSNPVAISEAPGSRPASGAFHKEPAADDSPRPPSRSSEISSPRRRSEDYQLANEYDHTLGPNAPVELDQPVLDQAEPTSKAEPLVLAAAPAAVEAPVTSREAPVVSSTELPLRPVRPSTAPANGTIYSTLPATNGHAEANADYVPVTNEGAPANADSPSASPANSNLLPSLLSKHSPRKVAGPDSPTHAAIPFPPARRNISSPNPTPNHPFPQAIATHTTSPTLSRAVPSPLATQATQATPPAPVTHAIPPTPISATSGSRPVSALGSATGGGQSILTDDTSPRSSFGGKTALSDPRFWSIEQVVQWGATKGFDGNTLNKFREHEISGDILLEFDVNSLKEIDLPAFGRRVHIFNAIKELRRQVDHMTTSQNFGLGSPASPALSGYIPDTPSSAANFSPIDSFNHSTNVRTGHSNVFGPPVVVPQSERHIPQTASVRDQDDLSLQGLGLDEAQRASPAPRQAPVASYTPSKTTTSRTATHSRSITESTVDSHPSVTQSGDLAQVEEEAESPKAATDSEMLSVANPRRGKKIMRSLSRNSSALSLNSKASEKTKRSSWYGSASTPAASATPTGSEPGKAKPGANFLNSLRGRKPPPRVPVPSSLAENDKSAPSSPKASPTKRGTKLFALNTSYSPSLSSIRGKKQSVAVTPDLIGLPIEEAQPLSSADIRAQQEAEDTLTPKSPLEQIGASEAEGWLRKKADKPYTWKMRYVSFKNMNLYILKAPTEMKVKGIIKTISYKVLPDPDSARGYYGFKLVAPNQPTHYFSSEDPLIVRKFMKALTKSSIRRDTTKAVVTSSHVPTIPLEEAQRLYPPPRPPSPSERTQIQMAHRGNSNPNSLSSEDAAKLMVFTKPDPAASPPSPARPPKRESRFSMALRPTSIIRSSSRATMKSPVVPSVSERSPMLDLREDFQEDFGEEVLAESPAEYVARPASARQNAAQDAPLLFWVNAHVPSQFHANDITKDFRNGHLLYQLVKSLSGSTAAPLEVPGVFKEVTSTSAPMEHLDPLLDLFDLLVDLKVPTLDVSIAEVLGGDPSQTAKLLKSIQSHFAA